MIGQYFEPAYSTRYSAIGFYDYARRGVADDHFTDDFDDLRDHVHDMLNAGYIVTVNDYETGGRFVITPGEYFEDFNGEGIQPYMFN